ncbi:hypothetical protein [Mycobacterium sp. TY815]|uniref:hypothetical protein n=1 Tax=Mycobacterium sp. TY815 TaxID=3050581 RepID=UPI00274101FC|nr:hypothetical protein [Mycobacterium sp. TY815]MDP7706443.1 hypothetical protein [Mycobacterium sp. TY815]
MSPPPGLPAPRGFRSAFAAAYALAYLIGGERRMMRLRVNGQLKLPVGGHENCP